MADVSWTAYALAMFTPEQRAAAIAAVLPPDQEQELIVRPPTGRIITRGPQGVRVEGLDPNIPHELHEIHARGYSFQNGHWVKLGMVVDPEAPEALIPGSVSTLPSAAFVPGGSVLGFTVPVAPAVLLPSFVGGRVGRVSIGEGLRPASGGGERVRFGRFAQVRGLSL